MSSKLGPSSNSAQRARSLSPDSKVAQAANNLRLANQEMSEIRLRLLGARDNADCLKLLSISRQLQTLRPAVPSNQREQQQWLDDTAAKMKRYQDFLQTKPEWNAAVQKRNNAENAVKSAKKAQLWTGFVRVSGKGGVHGRHHCNRDCLNMYL